MIGVFARADHPEGYGMGGGRAHGYVVLFVECLGLDELHAVEERLRTKEFHGKPGDGQYGTGTLAEWYGGKFDLIAVVPGFGVMPMPALGGNRFLSKGDNRFVGVYKAQEVLSV